jgi:hypothetical protein
MLTGDSHPHHFQYVLELKGLKRSEQQVFLDNFQKILLVKRLEQQPNTKSSSPPLSISQQVAIVPPESSSSHLSSPALFSSAGQEFLKASHRINENLRKFVLHMKRPTR